MAATSAKQIPARIRAEVERWTNELVALTSAFIEIPSENPPGAHLLEAQDWIRDQLERFGIPFDVVDSSRHGTDHRVIVGKVGDGGPVMYLHGHCDVIPAFGKEQFSARVVNGSIVGCGASDMKGGLVAMMVAAVIHRDLGGAGQIRLV